MFDFWIVGPSAIGSEKGRPSSMRSAIRSAMTNQFKIVVPTRATGFHSQQDIYCLVCCWISRCHVSDERRAIFPFALRKSLFDMLHDGGRDWKLCGGAGME